MVLSSTLTDIGFVDAAVVALLGYAVVFFGLVLLMIVVIGMGKIFIAKEKKVAAHSDAAKAAIAAVAALRSFFGSLGLPLTLGELGIKEPDFAAMTAMFHRDKGNPFGAYISLTPEETEAVYRLMV